MPQPQTQSKSALQSLPSFAQAFSSISNDDNAALPPIRTRSSPQLRPGSAMSSPAGFPADRRHHLQAAAPSRSNLRKRSRPSSRNDDYSSSERSRSPPPRVTFVKEEEYDQLDPSPPPSVKSHYRHPPSPRYDQGGFASSGGAPPPSLVRPLQTSKRRRVTISGVAQPLNTNLPPVLTVPSDAHTPQAANPQQQAGGIITAPPTTLISPVVMGFTIQKDDSHAIEQVKSMLGVRQRQKALIESRRSSGAGLSPITDGRKNSFAAGPPDIGRRGSLAGPGTQPLSLSVNIVNPTPTTATAAGSTLAGPRRPSNSPNAGLRRGPTPAAHPSTSMSSGPSNSNASPRSKPTMTVTSTSNMGISGPGVPPRMASPVSHPAQGQGRQPHQRSPPTMHITEPAVAPPSRGPPPAAQPQQANQAQLATQGLSALANALPPPPTSFARRRANQLSARGKPADILISPRDVPGVTDSYKSLQPLIQSAPAVPRHGQQPGRFGMALPSLPPSIGQRGVAIRKTAGQVPPTPTRLGTQRPQQGVSQSGAPNARQAADHLSPPTVAISSTANAHVHAGFPPMPTTPSTPATLHRAAHTSADKAAFLAPFEQFYDALADARVLKGWFSEQLARIGRVTRETEEHRKELERQKNEVEQMLRGEGLRETLRTLVNEAVDKETKVWRDEVVWLRSRLLEVEEGRIASDAGRSHPVQFNEAPRGITSNPTRTFNYSQPYSGPMPADTYSFPPAPSARSGPSGASGMEAMQARMLTGLNETRRPDSLPRSETSSPGPTFESGRRLSVSAMRYEQVPLHPTQDPQSSLKSQRRHALPVNGKATFENPSAIAPSETSANKSPSEQEEIENEKQNTNGTRSNTDLIEEKNGNVSAKDDITNRSSPKDSKDNGSTHQAVSMDTS